MKAIKIGIRAIKYAIGTIGLFGLTIALINGVREGE